ncbi:MAG: hypothetical protein JWO48_2987, partial [Bryobacterales bacterium]|nr:hypothetical protein [Bryobacterales bacterium]
GCTREVSHQVVLQKLRLIRCKLEFDISADAGIDAVDPLAARELRFKRRATFDDQRTRSRGKLHHASKARRLFHIFDGERMCAYHQRGGNGHARLFYREGRFVSVYVVIVYGSYEASVYLSAGAVAPTPFPLYDFYCVRVYDDDASARYLS